MKPSYSVFLIRPKNILERSKIRNLILCFSFLQSCTFAPSSNIRYLPSSLLTNGFIQECHLRITRSLSGSRRQDIYAEKALVTSDLKQLKLILTLSNARVDDWDASDPQNFRK